VRLNTSLTISLAAFDRRLDPASKAPLAVGFSGGSDSLALLKFTLDWASRHGRPVLSLTVDHGLQAGSALWTRDAVARARALGADARALVWTGDKPLTGLPAAARRARHALLADAARQAGARVLLLGHTADDLHEAAAMRAAGSTVSDPRAWSPSPVWPEGRGVFLLRPLLEVRREDLRDWLKGVGETWLDDPANDDQRYARARARKALAGGMARESRAPADAIDSGPAWLEWSETGVLTLPREASAARLAMACLCMAGSERPPRGDRVQALVRRLRSGEAFTATLAGARIEAGPSAGAISLYREAGEAARGGLAPLRLAPGQTGVWDGRYALTAGQTEIQVMALRGLAAGLSRVEREALKAVPAAARPALPVLVDAEGAVTCPILAGPGLAPHQAVRIEVLFLERFRAATGLIDQECVT
jgi:tRNA(Ile)-lysidine synthase